MQTELLQNQKGNIVLQGKNFFLLFILLSVSSTLYVEENLSSDRATLH